MPQRPIVRPGRRAVAAVCALALGACAHTTIDVPPPRRPEELWKEHFDRAERFALAGYYEQAERQYELALEAASELPPGDRREVETRLALAAFYRGRGRLPDVERQYRAVVELERRHHGERSEAAASALNTLGIFYTDTDRLRNATEVLEEAASIRGELYGPFDPLTAVPTQNLAEAYRRLGEFANAEALFRHALQAYRNGGTAFLLPAAVAQNQYARLLGETDRQDVAERFHVNAIRVAGQAGGTGRPEVAGFFRDLAGLYTRQGRFGEAEDLYVRSLELFQALLGPTHAEVRATLLDYAGMLALAGRTDEAARYLRRAGEIAEAR